MNILRLPHKHLNPETLAEYLDGRLAGTAMAQVNQRLTSCATCREELDSLRTTVSLLKQLPQVVLPGVSPWQLRRPNRRCPSLLLFFECPSGLMPVRLRRLPCSWQS